MEAVLGIQIPTMPQMYDVNGGKRRKHCRRGSKVMVIGFAKNVQSPSGDALERKYRACWQIAGSGRK
jgi:hypothetical protein